MANPVKRKDIQRLAHELVDGVDQLRRELAVADARVQQQSAEIERLRAAGDALYELVSVRLIIPADQHDDAVEQIRKWREARRG